MKRVLSLSLVVFFAAFAAQAVAAGADKYNSRQAQFETQAKDQVRDHRTNPVVRDHRTSDEPVVRDHRTPKAQPVVSTGPIVRDHRTPTGPFKPPVLDPVKPPKRRKPPVGPIKPPVADPVKPPKGPVKPPVGPLKPPKGPVKPPVDPGKPPLPPTKPPTKPPHGDHGHGHGHKYDFPWWKFLGGYGGGRYPYPYPYNYGRVAPEPVIIVNQAPAPAEEAVIELSPGMELTISGSFGTTPGQAGVKLGELLLTADVVRWQADAVVVRLPMAQIARSMSAELLITRADTSLARVIPFDLVPPGN